MKTWALRWLREVASKTSDVAGDGTTTATVLAQAIYTEGIKLVAAGIGPMELKRGMDKSVEVVVETLQEISTPTKDQKEIAQVGTISANNDETIGNIIAEAMDKVGKEGVITVEEAKSMETTLDVVEGMQFDRGYISPYFVTDPDRMEVAMDKPYLLLVEKKVSNMKDLLPVLESIAKTGQRIVIIAEDVEAKLWQHWLSTNCAEPSMLLQSKPQVLVIVEKRCCKISRYLTGGQVVTEDLGIKLENVTVDDLGTAKRIVIDKDNTTIIDGCRRQRADCCPGQANSYPD